MCDDNLEIGRPAGLQEKSVTRFASSLLYSSKEAIVTDGGAAPTRSGGGGVVLETNHQIPAAMPTNTATAAMTFSTNASHDNAFIACSSVGHYSRADDSHSLS